MDNRESFSSCPWPVGCQATEPRKFSSEPQNQQIQFPRKPSSPLLPSLSRSLFFFFACVCSFCVVRSSYRDPPLLKVFVTFASDSFSIPPFNHPPLLFSAVPKSFLGAKKRQKSNSITTACLAKFYCPPRQSLLFLLTFV